MSYIYYLKQSLELQALIVAIETCKISNGKFGFVFLIFGISYIVLQIITGFIYDTLNFTVLYKSTHLSSQRRDRVDAFVKFLVKILAIVSNTKELLEWEKNFILVLLLLTHMYLLMKLLYTKIKKHNYILESVECMFHIFIFSFTLAILIRSEVSLINNNLGFILASIVLWGSISYYNVLKFLIEKLISKDPNQIKS